MPMKIYRDSQKLGQHTMYVQPGTEDSSCTEFFDCNKHPILFSVNFNDNEAIVPDSVGKFMVDKGLAKMSPIIIPDSNIIERFRSAHASV